MLLLRSQQLMALRVAWQLWPHGWYRVALALCGMLLLLEAHAMVVRRWHGLCLLGRSNQWLPLFPHRVVLKQGAK
jgi:hypothetical protein